MTLEEISGTTQNLKRNEDKADSREEGKGPSSYWSMKCDNTVSNCGDSDGDCRDISENMDNVRPLKVPDIKISPKTLDCSLMENNIPKGGSGFKYDAPLKNQTQERTDKSLKYLEKVQVQRKLDFHSPGKHYVIHCDEVEPLRAPNVSVLSNSSKKKDYTSHVPQEKENRSKRAKKDNAMTLKSNQVPSDGCLTSKGPKSISKKEQLNFLRAKSIGKTKNDCSPLYAADVPVDGDFRFRKAKINDFVASTARKDPDKRHRDSGVRSSRFTMKDSSAESAAVRPGNNDSTMERTNRPTAKSDDNDKRSKSLLPESSDSKLRDDAHLAQHSIDQNYVYISQVSRNKHQSKLFNYIDDKLIAPCSKEQQHQLEIAQSPDTVEIDGASTICDSSASGEDRRASTATTSQQRKNVNIDLSLESSEDLLCAKFAEAFDNDVKRSEGSFSYLSSKDCSKDNDDSHTVVRTDHSRTNADSTNVDSTYLPEALLDPKKISFRDDSRNLVEFGALVTPDVNLMFKPKRKKLPAERNVSQAEVVAPTSAITEARSKEKQAGGVSLLHPTALHMQFQAELHLLDSFDESLKKVLNVEESLFNVKRHRDESKRGKDLSLWSTDFAAIEDSDNTTTSTTAKEISFSPRNEGRIASTVKNDIIATHRRAALDAQAYDARAASLNGGKTNVKVAEVQTQTVNDIATQTESHPNELSAPARGGLSELRGITFGGGSLVEGELQQLSLDSIDRYDDMERIEDISLTGKMRTMSEISLHETTSSIKTETGTEISISTRGLTCSFNKYLDLEIAQLLKDEKERYDKFAMLFKTREKTLHDRTRKLVKLEEQKRVLRDTGQDSRVSSVKKKQRALLLKLQQEKEEMNRLKELHKITSQERKSMLQKQRNMFNPQMSTKNILTKLKRSADNQSPRRLSGPMKGYDIRSNSSMSSLVDSDKSQHDQSQRDINTCTPDFRKMDVQKTGRDHNVPQLPPDVYDDKSMLTDIQSCDNYLPTSVVQDDPLTAKYEIKSRNFEEKMPKVGFLRLNSWGYDIDSKESSVESNGHCQSHRKERTVNRMELSSSKSNEATYESFRSESDTLVEELTKKSKVLHAVDNHSRRSVASRGQLRMNNFMEDQVTPAAIVDHSAMLKTMNSPQCPEQQVLESNLRNWVTSDKQGTTEKDMGGKKVLHYGDSKGTVKRKSTKSVKQKNHSNVPTESTSRAESTSQTSDDFNKPHNKRTKLEKQFSRLNPSDGNDGFSTALDLNEDQRSLRALLMHSNAVQHKNSKLLRDVTSNDYVISESLPWPHASGKHGDDRENVRPKSSRNVNAIDVAQDLPDRSRIHACSISRRSSEGSEKSYTKSVVIREEIPDFKNSKKLKQILSARESALSSRKNCVQEWMAWHAKLREEENRVAKMEETAMKLISANSNILAYHHRAERNAVLADTTVSSDTSDVEGRIENLAEKLAERRMEMSRLKREARKQAKHRLRALEANLLNQIKRYDTTIHEMRKKLEAKKEICRKSTENVAMECKTLSDYRVPDVILRRIQDIYRSNDLFRSKSEPDLSSTKILKEIGNAQLPMPVVRKSDADDDDNDADGNDDRSRLNPMTIVDKSDEDRRTTMLVSESEKGNISEMIRITKVSYGQLSARSTGSNEKMFPNFRRKEQLRIEERGEDYNNSPRDGDTIGSRDANVRKTLLGSANVIESRLKGNAIISGLCDGDEQLQHLQSGNSAVLPGTYRLDNFENSDSGLPLAVPKELDFFRRNRNLNDDITCLENELRAMSDMMLCSSRKSHEQSEDKVPADSGRTKNIDIEKMTNTPNELSEIVEENLAAGEHLLFPRDDDKSKDPARARRVIRTAGLPEKSFTLKSGREVDYRARSQEIMNEIEKSIISERIDAPEKDISSAVNCNSRVDKMYIATDLFSGKNRAPSTSDRPSCCNDGHNSTNELSGYFDGALEALKTNVDVSILKHEVQGKLQNSDNGLLCNSGMSSRNIDAGALGSAFLCENIEDRVCQTEIMKNIESTLGTSESADDHTSMVHDKFDGNGLNSVVTAVSNEAESLSASVANDSLRTNDPAKLFNRLEDHQGVLRASNAAVFEDKSLCRSDETLSSFQSRICTKDDSDVTAEINNSCADAVTASEYDSNVIGDSKITENLLMDTLDTSCECVGPTSTKMLAIREVIIDNAPTPEGMKCQNNDSNSVLPTVVLSVSKYPMGDVTNVANGSDNETSDSCAKTEGSVPMLSYAESRVSDVSTRSKPIGTAESSLMNQVQEVEDDSCDLTDLKPVGSNGVHERSDISPLEENISGDNYGLNSIGSTDLTRMAWDRNDRLISRDEEGPVTEIALIASRNDTQSAEECTSIVTTEVSKQSEYEDISEESLEISEILDFNGTRTESDFQRLTADKYQGTRRSEEVLRILDEWSKGPSPTEHTPQEADRVLRDLQILSDESQVTGLRGKNDEATIAENFVGESSSKLEQSGQFLDVGNLRDESHQDREISLTRNIHEAEELDSERHERDTFSETSDEADTPGGVSEIDTDSPQDPNNPRLDVEASEGGILINRKIENESETLRDRTGEYQEHRIVDSSEKDIQLMIDKLKASLEQPGPQDAEFEAKLLRIKQLKIELEIKKLEAEEVSYYVRDIPNKPPPPYTPPGSDRAPPASPDALTPLIAVVPSNVEELMAFTEKATATIYRAKQNGLNIVDLEVPAEMRESIPDGEMNETARNNRRIYDTFLFDLCKEIVLEVYGSEHEEPGPSWTKPNVKTKPAFKIPRSLEDLKEYVGKEVATLFGFKTKLQRENMVMRWSRKRRDRVDELLAREAQAEEDEWTKFHYDELAVKNGLTIAILDNLLMETVDVVKVAYTKKRRTMM